MNVIRTRLFPAASFANPSTNFTEIVRTNDGTIPVILSQSQRVAEQPLEVVNSLGQAAPGMLLRGLTRYDVGKILLSKDNWCIETLLHEALHSVSIFGTRTDLIPRYSPLVEGLTESLTQFLLQKDYPGPYANCLRVRATHCTLTYPYETRIWCAIASVIGYTPLTKIYFWQGNKDWEALFDAFIADVRKAGHHKFQNVLRTPRKLAPMVRLHQECGRRLGDKYSAAYRYYLRFFDL